MPADKEPTEAAGLPLRTATREIVDSRRKPHTVTAILYPTRGINHFNTDPSLKPHTDEVFNVLKRAFRDESPNSEATKSRFGYVSSDDLLVLIRDNEGLVAVQSYLVSRLPDFDGVMSLYGHYGAVDPEYQGGNITTKSLGLILDMIEPSVISGSTHSSSAYMSLVNSCAAKGLDTFPTPGTETAEGVFRLGQSILRESLGVQSVASLDTRLVRTTSSPYTMDVSGRSFPFFDNELNLKPEQAVLVMGVSKDLTQKITSKA